MPCVARRMRPACFSTITTSVSFFASSSFFFQTSYSYEARRTASAIACATLATSSSPPPAPTSTSATDSARRAIALRMPPPTACRTRSMVRDFFLPSPTTTTRFALSRPRDDTVTDVLCFPLKSPEEKSSEICPSSAASTSATAPPLMRASSKQPTMTTSAFASKISPLSIRICIQKLLRLWD